MNRLRLRMVGLATWLFLCFNIERILRNIFGSGLIFEGKVNLVQSYTYVSAGLVVLNTLLLPHRRHIAFRVFMACTMIGFLMAWYYFPLEGDYNLVDLSQVSVVALVIMVQLGIIMLTGMLSRQVSQALDEFEGVITNIAFNSIGFRPTPFMDAQVEMYRELKRARYYQRSFSIITLEVERQSLKTQLPLIIHELHQAMAQEYVMAKVGRILSDELHDFNGIALHDNCFLITMPETDSTTAAKVAVDLVDTLKEEIGISLQTEVASFPDDGITFETLIDQVIGNMRDTVVKVPSTGKEDSVSVSLDG